MINNQQLKFNRKGGFYGKDDMIDGSRDEIFMKYKGVNACLSCFD